jgi:uncharacterized RDD family membrane protein YckC
MPKGNCVHCKTIFDVFDNVVECESCLAVMRVTGWEPVELELVKPGTIVDKGTVPKWEQDFTKYTTGGRRFFAGFIDGLVLSMTIGLINSWVLRSNFSPILIVLWLPIIYFGNFAYSVLMHGYFGQTLGKMVCKIKVLNTSEQPITLMQAFLRDIVIIGINIISLAISINLFLTGDGIESPKFANLQMVIGVAELGWFVAEILTMLTNKKRRAVHDFIAGTVVVKV